MSRTYEDLQYTVEEWAGDNWRIIEALARVGNISIASAAYWAALAARRRSRIILCRKAQIQGSIAPFTSSPFAPAF